MRELDLDSLELEFVTFKESGEKRSLDNARSHEYHIATLARLPFGQLTADDENQDAKLAKKEEKTYIHILLGLIGKLE